MNRSIVNRAYRLLAESDALGRPPRGIAMPFGGTEPEYREWRVSPDVRRRLMASVKGLTGSVNPDIEERLLGIRLVVDETLPLNSMLLEPAADRMGRAIG